MPRIVARSLLVLGSLLGTALLLALIECLLAAFDVAAPPTDTAVDFGEALRTAEDTIVWDRDLLYRYCGNADFLGFHFYRTNSLGYRGPEFAPDKPKGVYRIACVGDSCTFGMGLREEDTIARRLESTLNRAFDGAARFEALNFGVVGYSTYQSTRQLEIDVARFAPDFVLYMPTAFNDATFAPEATDEARAAAHRGLASWLWRRRIVRLVGLARDRYELPERIELARHRDPERCRVPLADVARLAARALDAIASQGARAVVAISTLDEPLRIEDPSLQERLAVFERVARERGAVVARVGESLRAYEPTSLFLDGVHPNRDGVTAIVRTLFHAIVESDLVTESPRRAFLRVLVHQNRRGCFSERDPLGAFRFGAPDEVLRWLELARARSAAADHAAADDDVDSAFRRFDPMIGTERSRYGVARALLLDRFGIRDDRFAASESTRDAWIAEVEHEVRPRDLFARHLWGELAVGGPPTDDAIARARASTLYEHHLGIAETPRDRRLGVASRALAARDATALFAALEQVLALDPNEVEAWVTRARVRRAMANVDAARGDVEKALAIAPDHAGALGLAALLALDAGESERARPLLERAIRADPFAIDCRFGLAKLLLASGDREGARAELYTVLVLDRQAYPEAYELWRSLAEK